MADPFSEDGAEEAVTRERAADDLSWPQNFKKRRT